MNNTEPKLDLWDFLHKVIHNNPPSTLILMALAMAVWLIGGNLLIMSHYRRIGESQWSGFRPFAFPFAKFNLKEWCILALLAFGFFTLMAFAIPRQPLGTRIRLIPVHPASVPPYPAQNRPLPTCCGPVKDGPLRVGSFRQICFFGGR